MKVAYEVRGMTCDGCKRSLLRALRGAGFVVDDDDVSVAQGSLRLAPGQDTSKLAEAVDVAGFELGRALTTSAD